MNLAGVHRIDREAEMRRVIGALLSRLGGKADISLADLLAVEHGFIVCDFRPTELVTTYRVDGLPLRPPHERSVTLTRDAFMAILDKHLEEGGIKITVGRYNKILTDMGYELEEVTVSGTPETSQEEAP